MHQQLTMNISNCHSNCEGNTVFKQRIRSVILILELGPHQEGIPQKTIKQNMFRRIRDKGNSVQVFKLTDS